MRLYLSSFRIGNCPERLLELAGDGGSAAVIANAADPYPQEGRARRHRPAMRTLTPRTAKIIPEGQGGVRCQDRVDHR